MSKAYFDGQLFEKYEQYIKNFAGKCDLLNAVIQRDGKSTTDLKLPKSHERAFIDILLAYIHSPLQTRHGRHKLKDAENQKIFDEILENIHLEFYVQKVTNDEKVLLPHRLVVLSICIQFQFSHCARNDTLVCLFMYETTTTVFSYA